MRQAVITLLEHLLRKLRKGSEPRLIPFKPGRKESLLEVLDILREHVEDGTVTTFIGVGINNKNETSTYAAGVHTNLECMGAIFSLSRWFAIDE